MEPGMPPIGENAALRDSLALDRTELANERTLLAYLRTAFGFWVTGAVLIRFQPSDTPPALGIAMIAGGVVFLTIGLVRFRRINRKLQHARLKLLGTWASADSFR